MSLISFRTYFEWLQAVEHHRNTRHAIVMRFNANEKKTVLMQERWPDIYNLHRLIMLLGNLFR